MAVSGNLFAAANKAAWTSTINFTSDTLKMALVTVAPSAAQLLSWVHYSDVTNEVAAGGGYSTGGQSVTGASVTVYGPLHTSSTPWTQVWTSNTSYSVGNLVKPTNANENGYLFRCYSAGSSASVEPTWNTVVGQDITDQSGGSGGVHWVTAGESVTVFTAANVVWTSSTISAAAAILYDAQSGTGSTEPLISVINFGGTVSSTNAPFTVSPDANLGYFSLTPA